MEMTKKSSVVMIMANIDRVLTRTQALFTYNTSLNPYSNSLRKALLSFSCGG